MNSNPAHHKRMRVAWSVVLLAVAATALLVRSLLWAGFWGDEPYGLSTAYRYYLGDRPLVDSWDTNFSSAILALPFVHLYLSVVGSTEGILLAFRSVLFALTSIMAVSAVAILKNVLSWWRAVAVGLLLLLYIPYLSVFVGYGADVVWHMLAALAAVELLEHPRRGAANAVPGVLCALGILGNPPTVVVVPFFAFALWLAHRRAPESDHRTAVGWYLTGGGVIGLIFLLTLRLMSGPDLFSALGQIASPDDHDFGLSAHIARLWFARWVLAIPLAVGVLAGVTQRVAPARWRVWTTALVLLSCLSLASWALATQRVTPLLVAPQSIVFATGAGLFLAFVVSGTVRIAGWQLLLVFPAVGAGLGWALGSNGGVGTGIVAAPLILAAALAWWPAVNAAGPAPVSEVLARASASVLLALTIGVTAAFGMLNTAGGGPAISMTTPINRGPFKGMITTQQDALMHSQMVASIERLPPVSGRVVFMERFPLGYLMLNSPPGTYSTWVTATRGTRLDEYVALTGNRPSRIILTRFADGPGDGEFPPTVSLSGFASAYEETYSDEYVKVFDMVPASPSEPRDDR